jgi:hypothetical protein
MVGEGTGRDAEVDKGERKRKIGTGQIKLKMGGVGVLLGNTESGEAG